MKTRNNLLLIKTVLVLTIAISWIALEQQSHARSAPGLGMDRDKGHMESVDSASRADPWRMAQQKRFAELWGQTKDWTGGILNPFLGTRNPYVKWAVFVVLVFAFYLTLWFVFQRIIMGDHPKSPRPPFLFCFLSFLVSVYLIAFVCFSEYTLTEQRTYNGVGDYLSQLNWAVPGIGLFIWIVISTLLTFWARGKH